MLLETKDVVKRYAEHTALSGVSISIPKQSIFGLLGPNGAGKTSLIRIINQITAPDSGEVLFNGAPINSTDVGRIGYLPEERGLYKKMKVGEQAMYLARLKGMEKSDAKARLEHWFDRFDIQAWWNKPIEELSKGMAQKVQFITTVMHEPELLILDEPFSGFDPINADIIKREILELREKGATVIFSTHNMNSVEEICDDIALINKSENILSGKVSDIKRQYSAQTLELEFKGSMADLAAGLWINFELVEKLKEGPVNRVRLRKLKNDSTNTLLQQILNKVQVISIHESVPTMNEIFIQAVTEKQDGGQGE